MTNDLGERRDLADERDSEEYQAMYAEVEAEIQAFCVECGFPDDKPDGRTVHEEAMRRLKEKYESACSKD